MRSLAARVRIGRLRPAGDRREGAVYHGIAGVSDELAGNKKTAEIAGEGASKNCI
jgi:hypothetical protein